MTTRSRLPIVTPLGAKVQGDGKIIVFGSGGSPGTQGDVVGPSSVVARRPAVFSDSSGNVIDDDGPMSLPVFAFTHSSGVLALNRNNGEYQRINLNGNATSVTLSGWPITNEFGRLQLEIINGGAFAINNWPGAVIWLSGSLPVISVGAGKVTMIMLWTSQGGSSVLASVVGQQ